MYPAVLRLIPCLFTLLLLGGCLDQQEARLSQDIKDLSGKIAENEQSIGAVSRKIENIDGQIKQTQTTVIDQLKTEKRQAAAYVFGASTANGSNTQANLYTAAIGDELLRATAVLGYPTAEDASAANLRLQQRLSQKEQDLVALRRSYEEQDRRIADLLKAREQSEQAITLLSRTRDESAQERGELRAQVDVQKTKLIEKEKETIGLQQEKIRRAEDVRGLKNQLMIYLGIAGILTGIGAAVAFRLYPPITLSLTIASAAFIAAAAAIPFVTIWMVVGFGAVAGLGIAAAAWIRYTRTRQVADNAIGAIEQMKNSARDGDAEALNAYQRLRCDLTDWFGAGDHELSGEIQGRLRTLNVIGKTPKELPPPPVR